jgi:hypothetical protein
MKSIFVALQLLMYINLTACVVGPPRNIQSGGYGAYSGYPGGYGGGRTYSAQEVQVFLNEVIDPTLISPYYKNCFAGDLNKDGNATHNSMTHRGSTSITCEGVAVRRDGVNVGSVPTPKGKGTP